MDKDRAVRSFLVGVLTGFCFEYFRSLIQDANDCFKKSGAHDNRAYFDENEGDFIWRNRLN